MASDGDAEESSEGEIDPGQVFASLADARVDIVDASASATEHFSWTFRGGMWTRQNRGVDWDSFRSFAATREAKAFLRRCGLPLSATFAVSRYGEHACGAFCRYWVARMSFFMQLEGSQPEGGGDIFGEAALSAFEEPADFRELAAGATGHASARAEGLRAMRPTWADM